PYLPSAPEGGGSRRAAPMKTALPQRAPRPGRDVGAAALSPWGLIRRRFRRHRLALVSLYLLAVIYTMAAGAEFFAPYTRHWRDREHAYAPPQLPRISWSDGLYVPAMTRLVDPVTFRKSYVEDADRRVRLGFFVKGEP